MRPESASESAAYDAAEYGSPVIRTGPDEPICPAHDPSSVNFGCTRNMGHAGQHVAEGTSQVWAVWS